MTTNYAKAKYTEIIDLQTTNNKVSIIGIHCPIGSKPRRMLNGFFSQFRKFRYKGISSLRIVPAANLPIDPLGLSGIPGTTDVMDPRDALNPIMFHGCHGDHLSIILDTIYKEGRYDPFTASGDSLDIQERDFTLGSIDSLDRYYYSALSDPSWKKFGIQSGVSLKGLRPLVHKVALTKQLVPTSQIIGTSSSGSDFGKIYGGSEWSAPTIGSTSDGPWDSVGLVDTGEVGDDVPRNEWNINQMFTNGVTSLGWLPTTSWYHKTSINAAANPANQDVLGEFSHGNGTTTFLPKLFMGVLLLPPSYKCEQFFRCSITHEFEFKDFTTSLDPANQKLNYAYNDFIDHGDSKDISVDDAIKDSLDLDTLDVIGGTVETVTSGVN